MSMSLRQAQALVAQAIDDLKAGLAPSGALSARVAEVQKIISSCAEPSTVLTQRVNDMQNKVAQLRGGGYRLERLESALRLANEIQGVQKGQQARLAALLNEAKQVAAIQENQYQRMHSLMQGLEQVR